VISRPCLLFGLGCSILILAATACQTVPVGGPTPTTIPRPTAPVSPTAPALGSVVWARVPYCGCIYGDAATDNVTAALKKEQLAGTVKTLNSTGGWLYFVVGFDPRTAAREQIAAAIVAGGGEVVAGPP
jgi:hypothetical protein